MQSRDKSSGFTPMPGDIGWSTDCLDGAPDTSETVPSKSVTFTINGAPFTVTSSVSPRMLLVDFIRDRAKVKGTKVLCREGGCGACTVVVTVPSPVGDGTKTFSINSCQVLVYACSGWAVQTIESLGNRYDGYHPIQKSMVGMYGTQCGFCSPGMIMSIYGELQLKGQLTSEQVERALDGNLCRCTGYRPILDAFKAFAVDGAPVLKQRLVDIEESYKTPCSGNGQCKNLCPRPCAASQQAADAVVPPDSHPVQWYEPHTLNGLCSIMAKSARGSYFLVAGNTGSGIYKDEGPFSRYISLSRIPELQEVLTDSVPLKFGARVSLATCVEEFDRLSSDGPAGKPGYRHLKEIAAHWKVVANVSIRNNGSWAGNLILRHLHREFPSDLFITLAACNASLAVLDAATKEYTEVPVEHMDNFDFSGKVVVSMTIPPLPEGTFVRTQKITRRAVNAHTYVSAALRIPLDPNDGFKVTDTPGLFFAGVGPDFVSAARTAAFLTHRRLSDNEVVKGALRTLSGEVVPVESPLDGGTTYRKALALALFYKTAIWLMAGHVSPELKSAGDKLTKSLSKGQQSFDENRDTWPMGKPVPKLESSVQVSGEAEYTDDILPATGELYGAFVQSAQANAKIDGIDATDAFAMKGVVGFFTAADVPGVNSFVEAGASGGADKVFASGRVQYAGQSVGLVVAETKNIATAAARLVKVTYSDVKIPVTTIKEAIKARPVVGRRKENSQEAKDNTKDVTKESANTIKGETEIGPQFHFMLEALCARVLPTEDGYNVACTTQHMAMTQTIVAQVLKIPANSITMEVRRLGGAFGGKISRANLLAGAAAVAASKLRRPVRITLDLHSHMTLVGWRDPYYASYEVGFADSGKLDSVNMQIYADAGFVSNDSSASIARMYARNVYQVEAWKVDGLTAQTDTAANTWCRTPGGIQGLALMENIMEHVAAHLGKDPLVVREANLFPSTDERKNKFATDILPLLKQKSMIDERRQQVAEFNKANKFRKRGISLTPFLYRISYPYFVRYTATVIVYEHDGTVDITHGGIEMGQGLNTKAAQTAAYTLGLPLSMVKVKPSSSISSANSQVTGGSWGSDLVAFGVKQCCDKINGRIATIKKALEKPLEWPELVKLCYKKNMDLCERYWTDSNSRPGGYDVFGGCVTEVEIDVLTGQFVTRRVDIVEDVGRSISPLIDMGQVEGAYIMGMGLFTTEDLIYNENTGEKLCASSWNYKPPTALDIPEDFRVTFLPNSSAEEGMLGSKATGEPPMCLSYTVVTALRHAISSARADGGVTGWFPISTPLTVEKIQSLCYVKPLEEVI